MMDDLYAARTANSCAIEEAIVENKESELTAANSHLEKEIAERRDMISKLSYSNLKLAKSLADKEFMQNQLELYNRQLETLVEEKTKHLRNEERLAAIGQTAGMVGHDIRNPLQAITSEICLGKNEISTLPEGEKRESYARV
jgi:C4-dicarboxylate-specific signal transduction histidine kinase